MAADSGGGGRVKKQRVDDQCEAVGSDAIRADRISALPEELRLHVLTDLPLKDAIRTGALARVWRDLWKRRWAHRVSLQVRISSNDDLRRELDALERERPRRHLDRCSLIVETQKLKSSELRRFLDYAADCDVEYLHAETRKSGAAAKLKFHLPLLSPALACLSLRDITLSMFYKGTQRPFDALEVIRLVSVSFRPEAFTKMMVVCPSLLTLDLRRCKCNGDRWNLYWPPPNARRIIQENLRSLTIEDCCRITILNFVRVPSLRSFRYCGRFYNWPSYISHYATLSDLHIQLYDSVEWNIHKFRSSLPEDLSSLRVLTMCHKTLTGASILSAGGTQTRAQLPNFNLHSLRELHLLMFEMKAVNLSNLYMFFKTCPCPNLERLFVQLPAYRDEPMKGSADQVWKEPPEDGLDNLVMVKVMNFNWCPTEVRLVSFLLRKATSLRKLLIVSHNVTLADSPGAPEADLSLFNEALVNGKIVLTESDNAATQPYHEAFIKAL